VPPLDLPEIVAVIIRRWWMVVLVPLVALAAMIYRDRTLPYQSTLRASVVFTGDTEIPGNAEKPELMVMDDAPGLVTSRAFAEAVAAKTGAGVTVADVQASLGASRYSRLLSITATNDDAARAKTIATAAGDVLPEMVNQYLVANPATPATVQIIDPASEPTRSRPHQKLIILAETCVALAAGAFLAVIVDYAARWRSIGRATSPRSMP
jgi:capsular polysaccharide biosynthesis protein